MKIAFPTFVLFSRFRSRFCSNGTKNGNNRTTIGANLIRAEETAAAGTPCEGEGEEGSDYKIRAGRRLEPVAIIDV